MTVVGILAAGGKGERLGAEGPKAFVALALAMLSELIGTPDELAMVGIIVFLAGLFRLLYALLFEDGPYRQHLQRQPAHVPQPHFAPPREVSALPPQQSQPARSYAPPRPDTAELAYRPSVTEGTTRLLEREPDEQTR